MTVLPERQHAKIDLQRLDAQAGRLECFAGKLAQELIQTAIAVGEAGGLARRLGQVDSSHTAQKALQPAFLQQLTGCLPVLLTGKGQLIEIAAGCSRREDEGIAEELRVRLDGAAVATGTSKRDAVEIAIHCLDGV